MLNVVVERLVGRFIRPKEGKQAAARDESGGGGAAFAASGGSAVADNGDVPDLNCLPVSPTVMITINFIVS